MNKRKPKRRSRRKETKGKKKIKWIIYNLKGGLKKYGKEKKECKAKSLG